MAILLASLHTFECYTAAVDGVAELDNGEHILDRHDIVMESLAECEDDDEEYFDEDEFEEHSISPIVPPLNVYSSGFGQSFGEED